jgi:hypothetical protein
MLSQISWTLLIVGLAIAAMLYYGFIAIVYYPKETLTLLLGKKNKLPPGTAFLPSTAPRLSIMGAAQPDGLPEDYLERYRPAVLSGTPGETVVEQPAVQGPQAMAVPVVSEDEEEALFMVASDHNGSYGIEVADMKNLAPDAQLHSSVSDLMASVQTLLRVIREGEGNVNDVVDFFPSLLAQYPLVSKSKYRYAINQFIHDNCKSAFTDELSLESINELWCFPYPPQAA